MAKINKHKIVFWGTPNFLAVPILNKLKDNNILPELIVTAPDRPAGRGQKMSPPPVKVWGEKHNIPVIQPEKIKADFIHKLKRNNYNLFMVVAYGKILPKEIIDIPKYGTINVHPSLLPKFRGATPVQSAILSAEKETGVTIMLMDEEMDHGPILAQKHIDISNIPSTEELGENLAVMAGEMIVDLVPKLFSENTKPLEQKHTNATYTKKIKKEDGLIDLNDIPEKNYRKFKAYCIWPGVYFFETHKEGARRVKITSAILKNNKFIIQKVIRENKKETNYRKL